LLTRSLLPSDLLLGELLPLSLQPRVLDLSRLLTDSFLSGRGLPRGILAFSLQPLRLDLLGLPKGGLLALSLSLRRFRFQQHCLPLCLLLQPIGRGAFGR
jgi:hypothetical protein